MGSLIAVIALAVVTMHAVSRGEREMTLSDAAFRRADLELALAHARRAAVLYAPGALHVDAAYKRLVAIAVGSEATGRPQTAVRAWRAVRGAILETQHLWIPRRDLLQRSNHRLAALEAVEARVSAEGPVADLELAAALQANPAPRLGWTAILISGLLLWCAGIAGIAMRGVGPDGAWRLREARWAVLVLVLGVACWTLAVLQA
ncbi:MAG: hypothetical protein JW940_28800 [Polyangiaceae bacterium]|nr:hypothetical protein [Polyangiaceae bacterium]